MFSESKKLYQSELPVNLYLIENDRFMNENDRK